MAQILEYTISNATNSEVICYIWRVSCCLLLQCTSCSSSSLVAVDFRWSLIGLLSPVLQSGIVPFLLQPLSSCISPGVSLSAGHILDIRLSDCFELCIFTGSFLELFATMLPQSLRAFELHEFRLLAGPMSVYVAVNILPPTFNRSVVTSVSSLINSSD